MSYDENQNEWNLTDTMDLIVTHDFLVGKTHYSLPKFIKLVNLRPGKPKFMKKRSGCVVRYHKLNRSTYDVGDILDLA